MEKLDKQEEKNIIHTGLNYQKLKSLTGLNDISEQEAEELIYSIKTLVEILLNLELDEENNLELAA